MTPEPSLKPQFPALRDPGSPPLVYLDSATTTLPPQVVVDRLAEVVAGGGGAHRSVHRIGVRASSIYEDARSDVARWLGGEAQEVVFVRSATEGIHLVADGWARPRLGPGDEVCVSEAEHHSNLLPWRRVCAHTGARCVVLACDARGDLDRNDLREKLSPATRVVALTHVSNVTGAVTPVAEVAEILRRSSASSAVLAVDGAQAVAHLPIDVASLGCDFYTFSAHKVYGPPGVGIVWGRAARWSEVTPHLVGGGMVEAVTEVGQEFVAGAARFEAGTPNVAGAAASATGLAFLASHRGTAAADLASEAAEALAALPGVRVLGDPRQRVGAVSFSVAGIHPHDLGGFADARGVALRVGHLCAEPLLRHFESRSAIRASFGLYNDREDLAALIATVQAAQAVFLGIDRGPEE